MKPLYTCAILEYLNLHRSSLPLSYLIVFGLMLRRFLAFHFYSIVFPSFFFYLCLFSFGHTFFFFVQCICFFFSQLLNTMSFPPSFPSLQYSVLCRPPLASSVLCNKRYICSIQDNIGFNVSSLCHPYIHLFVCIVVILLLLEIIVKPPFFILEVSFFMIYLFICF